jgi:predicted TIM-barrel fold metal-dependent hydrolase
MSEAYTRALHLCFTKTSVQDPTDTENEVPAIESQQEDNSIISSVIAEVETKVDNDTLEKVGSTFDFADVKDDLDDDNVTTRVYTAVGGQATQPEFVDTVQSMSHSKRVIVAVVAQPHGEATGVYLRKQFIELNDGAASQLTMGEEQELQAAAEALYTPFGVKMVFGMSGVVKALAQ